MNSFRWLFAALTALFLLQVGCGAMELDGAGDDDDDDTAGGDGDADGDADAADAGPEADGEDSPDTCGDSMDNDSNGLFDCADPGCAGLVECCDEVRRPLLEETFDQGLDLGRWKPFGDGRVEVRDTALYPSGDDTFESGVVTNERFPLTGVVALEFTATVPVCDGPCSELVGVALTGRSDYADSSAVEPAAGLVLEKSTDQAQLLLVVNGAVEQAAPVQGAVVSMTLEVGPDRRIRVTDDLGTLWFDSASGVDPSLTDVYVAIFGRSGSTAGVGEVKLTTGACTLPSSVHRPGPAPLLAAGLAPYGAGAVRSPAVAVVPSTGDLEMLFTGITSGTTSIGHALSSDGGTSWDPSPGETPILTGNDMPLGYTNPDDPALLVRSDTDRVAVVSVESLADASQRFLVFASSADGLSWAVHAGDPIAPPEDCYAIRHPALIEPSLEQYVLYFSCETAEGLSTIKHATSADLASWAFDPLPVLPASGTDDREVDGTAAPTILTGSGLWEMWFEARSGVRRVLRYAASMDGAQWQRWDGVVLEPAPGGSWDDLQVGDPAAVVVDVPALGSSQLLLYYTGFGPDGQAIGLVTRDLPTF